MESEYHVAVGDVGFEEDGAVGDEAELFVETDDMSLSVQEALVAALVAEMSDGGEHEVSADAGVAAVFGDGDAADLRDGFAV